MDATDSSERTGPGDDGPPGLWLPRVREIALDAGRVVMDVYATDFSSRDKADASPVTEADERAETLIVAALRRLAPGVPIVAEEAAAAGRVPVVGRRFWLVDPLDGTREFVARNGEFTVNIALVDDGVPVLGVVFAPALGRLFAGVADVADVAVDAASAAAGGTAYAEDATGRRHTLRCRHVPPEGLTVVASRSHGDAAALDAVLAGRRVAARVHAGSSLKFCLIAAGEADLYPRLGRTMEWDTAAGHAVLSAAGGRVDDLAGERLRYGKPGFENPHFIARGQAA